MNRAVLFLALIPLSYLIGSIPFGLIIGLARGVDPRKAGSGNIGATNLGRLLGGKFFALVFTLDLLKGALPTLLAGILIAFRANDQFDYLLWILTGSAAIAGHLCSVFLRFKGGKGVATSAGVILGIFPYYTLAALTAVAAFLIVFGMTRTVSLGSMIGALTFPVAYATMGSIAHWPMVQAQLPLLIFSIMIPAMIIYKHRANIARLLGGTENRFRR